MKCAPLKRRSIELHRNLGHLIGATGAVLVTLCIGGGQGIALALENL